MLPTPWTLSRIGTSCGSPPAAAPQAGNAFVVYNHTTGHAFVETISRGQLPPRRGLVRIVTIPVVLVIGLGVEVQLRWFQRRGVRRLLAVMKSQAENLRAAPV